MEVSNGFSDVVRLRRRNVSSVRSAAFCRRRSELTLSGRNKLGVMHGIEQRIDDPVERLSRATPF
jgi:hypothetical protein